MRQNILIAMFFLLAISRIVTAAALPIDTSYQDFLDWLPILLIGIMTAISLVVIYYFVGVALNSPRIKISAVGEMQQILGSVVILVLVLGLMYLVGSGLYFSYQSALGQGANPVTTQISDICTNVLVHSQVDFLNSQGTSANYPGGYPNLPQPTKAVCDIVATDNGAAGTGTGAITRNIDYGLAANYVIVANLTNQSIQELNYLYNYDSLLFFLRSVVSYGSFCETGYCIFPLYQRAQEETISYSLYRGYVFQRTIMPTMDTQANISIYMDTIQLVLILILLLTWPYLLAVGILFRTFSFTRRAGGLIIAVVLIGTVIYPVLTLFQFTALNNLAPPGAVPHAGQANVIGASIIPSLPLCGVNIDTPTASAYTQNYNGPQGRLTSEYQVFCYTGAKELNLSTVYQGTAPSVGTSPRNPTQNICANDGQPTGKNFICACPAGQTGWFRIAYPTQKVAPCYVQKSLSFYVYPNAGSIIRLYSCYPPDFGGVGHPSNDTDSTQGIIDLEVAIVNHLNQQSALKILLSLSTIFTQGIGGSASSFSPENWTPGLPCGIAPDNIFSALFSLVNLYGLLSVTSFIIPLMNVLMLLSATFGLSSLMGGETNIIGLSRFI